MRVVAGLIVASVLAGWAVAGRSEPARPDRPAKPYGVGPQSGFAHLPAASCSASACHGGGQGGRTGSEHTTWAPDLSLGPNDPHDPHAKAYRVLLNPDSVRIAKLLGRGPAHKDTLCLKCHAPAGVADESAASEGVGCSACHGPAEKWVNEHYLPAWNGLSNRAKWEQYGFVPTKNLVARIANCATCHVGSVDREVNHDLIAAGHPRLAFEYTRFHFRPSYRKHWEERTPQPAFEERAWVVGQAASLRAAVDLLRSRAHRAKTEQAPWPEFAGYSCYACHQSIGKDEPKAAATPGRRLGLSGWEVWYTAAAGTAAGESAGVFPGAIPGRLDFLPPPLRGRSASAARRVGGRLTISDHDPPPAAPLRSAATSPARGEVKGPDGRELTPSRVASPRLPELGKLKALMARPNPNPAAVETQAASAMAELDVWLAALQAAEDRGENSLLPGTVPRVVRELSANAAGASDWDALAASYLGCGAMFHAAGGSAAHPGWAAPLAAIHDDLRFPHPYGERFDSPAGFDKAKLDRVRATFGQLRDAATLPGIKR